MSLPENTSFFPNQALYKDEPQSEIELFALGTDQARCNSHVQVPKLKSQTNFKLEISKQLDNTHSIWVAEASGGFGI